LIAKAAISSEGKISERRGTATVLAGLLENVKYYS
jgi:hypothetical protein